MSNSSKTENLHVYLGNSADAATMLSNASLFDGSNNSDLSFDSTSDIIPQLNGVYCYGFYANSVANSGSIYLDNIQIKEIPVAALAPASCITLNSM
ncbi:MAG: hypothetical protein IPO70_14930 [Bacteroidetes bacterium]|nr:hypothetical protein [Bacteroidota bacterium]